MQIFIFWEEEGKGNKTIKEVKTFFSFFVVSFRLWDDLYIKQRVFVFYRLYSQITLKQEMGEVYRDIFPWCQCLLWCIQESKKFGLTVGIFEGVCSALVKQWKNNKDFFFPERISSLTNILLRHLSSSSRFEKRLNPYANTLIWLIVYFFILH